MKQSLALLLVTILFLGCSGTESVDQIKVTNNNVPEPKEEQVVMLKVTGMT